LIILAEDPAIIGAIDTWWTAADRIIGSIDTWMIDQTTETLDTWMIDPIIEMIDTWMTAEENGGPPAGTTMKIEAAIMNPTGATAKKVTIGTVAEKRTTKEVEEMTLMNTTDMEGTSWITTMREKEIVIDMIMVEKLTMTMDLTHPMKGLNDVDMIVIVVVASSSCKMKRLDDILHQHLQGKPPLS
jgi:hypothetical protein